MTTRARSQRISHLLGLLERRDDGSVGRSLEVASLAASIAERMGIPTMRSERVWLAGILLDVGMLAVRSSVLGKPGPLSPAEREEIEGHVIMGARLLVRWGLGDLAEWVRAHHERFDGTGYPGGFVGLEAPLEARILSVASSYIAMTSPRAYAPVLTPAEARAELVAGANAQFDPLVVEIALKVLGAERSLPEPCLGVEA